MKILYYGESPVIITGFSQVSRYILDRLYRDGHSLEVVAMNHFVDTYDHQKYPYPITPCHDNEGRNTEAMKNALENSEFDLFIFAADLGGSDDIINKMLEVQARKPFATLAYCPVDCDLVPPSVFNYLASVNVPIVYTQHGKKAVERIRPDLRGKINVIPLGTNPSRFFPLSTEQKKAARKELFNIEDDTFIFLNINRNQARKDLGRTLMIFHEFHKTHPSSVLYLHSKQNDLGGSLPAIAQSIGMTLNGAGNEVIFTDSKFHEVIGFDAATINKLYNACDCLISTSTGEGWGLSTTEAMSAGCPVIVPGNTANIEIVGEKQERGLLVKTGGDIDHMGIPYGMSSNPRDIVHSTDMLVKMHEVYSRTPETAQRASKAREWALNNTWDHVTELWSNLLCQLEPLLQELRVKTEAI